MAAAGLRSVPVLTNLTSGITRLRDKGGASPQALYDLLNGYIDISGSPRSRDGTTVDNRLTTGTKGLCAFKGKLNVFAMTNINPGSSRYVVNILIHPNPAFAGTLSIIYFAKPFLGYLYVVAGFSDGSIYHYWLQSSGTWKAGTQYQLNQIVVPSVPNGYTYAATTQNAPTGWTPNTQVAVGAIVQPTVYNGFQYTCTTAIGDNPATGSTEPTWPQANGATVSESVDTLSTPIIVTYTSTVGSPAGSNDNGLYPPGSTTP